ncbi:hypothetical protein [Acidithiobacillus albertensis]|uniref:hypothetical protein n=1 Tax=Acidithiobacillus albertensis TaxID=119978 RepID=UPI00094B70A0|nr:hypothetical protein [Acidithiobacillus albertensis]
MSSHPMIQPVDWSQPPEQLRNAMPEDRRQIYQIIWNCALAATLVAPRLRHERVIYAHDGIKIAVHAVIPALNKRGYWRFRKDIPALPFPASKTSIPRGKTYIKEVSVLSVSGITMGALITEITRRGISTPASIARLMRSLIEGGSFSGNILWDQSKFYLAISSPGAESLKEWGKRGLLGKAQSTTQLVKAIEHGDKGYYEACAEIFENDREKELHAAAYIDKVCTKWKGLGREEGLNALSLEEQGLPMHEGLPAWIDPEKLLPGKHPLRDLKRRIEQEMISAHPAWRAYEDQKKASFRLEWLQKHAEEYQGILPAMTDGQWRMSALRYWLTGAKS